MPLHPRLLEILVCPACREPVTELEADRGLQCAACGRIYPIVDGIPTMLVDKAILPPKAAPESS